MKVRSQFLENVHRQRAAEKPQGQVGFAGKQLKRYKGCDWIFDFYRYSAAQRWGRKPLGIFGGRLTQFGLSIQQSGSIGSFCDGEQLRISGRRARDPRDRRKGRPEIMGAGG